MLPTPTVYLPSIRNGRRIVTLQTIIVGVHSGGAGEGVVILSGEPPQSSIVAWKPFVVRRIFFEDNATALQQQLGSGAISAGDYAAF